MGRLGCCRQKPNKWRRIRRFLFWRTSTSLSGIWRRECCHQIVKEQATIFVVVVFFFCLLPNPTIPASWTWHSPVLRHMIFTRPRASSPNDGRLGHLLLHMQLETWALGVPVSSYCCSGYRVEDPFSSLGTFSSSSIGGPVIHPIADCEHPLLCLLGTSIAYKSHLWKQF